MLVQYKAMEKAEKGAEFRWQDGDQFAKEVERMDPLLELAKCAEDNAPEGFRLCSNPFFLKFCSRTVFNPDDKGLFKWNLPAARPLEESAWKRATEGAAGR